MAGHWLHQAICNMLTSTRTMIYGAARLNPLTVEREKTAWIGVFASLFFCGLWDLSGSLVSLPLSEPEE